MNWIEIDKILYGIIARHDAVEDMLSEAKKQFKWTDSQAQAAVLPLLKRNKNNDIPLKTIKKVANTAKAAINKTRKGKG